MKRIELNLNVDNAPISTIGELRKAISPFTNECEITPIRMYYLFDSDGAIIKIELTEEIIDEANDHS